MADQLPRIELEDHGSKGRYVLRGPGGAEAEMTFTKIGEHQLIIDHTEVPESLRGRGIAQRLARAALEYAREQGLAVVPNCPFVRAYIRKHPEYASVT